MAVAAPARPSIPRRGGGGRRVLLGLAAVPAGLLALLLLIVLLVAGEIAQQQQQCAGGALPGDIGGPGSLGQVAGTGLSQTQIRTLRGYSGGATRVTPGEFETTSYGPPWSATGPRAINGAGKATAGGIVLDYGAPRYYMVAADMSVLSMGALVYIWPNPFGWRGPFAVADTGSAIIGNRVDFYDWRGAEQQFGWGRRTVHVSDQPIKAPGGDGAADALTRPVSAGSEDVSIAPPAATACGVQVASGPLGPVRRATGPRRLAPLPPDITASPQQCDARIVDDVVKLAREYRQLITSCYGIHSTNGEHPLGAAIDTVPADGNWNHTMRLAKRLGWQPACAASGVAPACARPPFRFIGYNGFPNHGDPAHCVPCAGGSHLHLSWMTSASSGQPENASRTSYFAPSWIDTYDADTTGASIEGKRA